MVAKATAGDPAAQFQLAVAYDSGRGEKRNLAEAASWYEKSAQGGFAEAQNSIGSLYLSGEGVPKDEPKACEWFAKAAAQENARGLGNSAFCYDRGIGVDKDAPKAAVLYERAANKGDVQSMVHIGFDYWKGQGVDPDPIKGYMWLDLARFYTQVGRETNRRLKWKPRGYLDEMSKEMSPEAIARAKVLSRAWDENNRAKVMVPHY
jgi:TPR repeat protein